MFVIGITGGIGCGKSTLASLCQEAGLPVLDADQISRAATAPGGSAIADIKTAFGPGVIDEKGGLDRAKMAKQVFRNKRALDELSAIVHRIVLEEIGRTLQTWTEKRVKAVVLDVPIPVRHGFLDRCNQVWVVWSADDIRLKRLSERGMSEEEARRRMNMQMAKADYLALADHIIENDGDLDELRQTVQHLLEEELSVRGIRFMSLIANNVESEAKEERHE